MSGFIFPEGGERAVSDAEKALIRALLANAKNAENDQPLAASMRRQLEAKVDLLTTARECGCGKCPTVDFIPYSGEADTLVLEAYDRRQDAKVMLFIQNDELQCLEIVGVDPDEEVVLPQIADLEC